VEFPREETANVTLVAKSKRSARPGNGGRFQEASTFSVNEGIASPAVDARPTALRFFHRQIVVVEFLRLQRPGAWELAVVHPFDAVLASVPVIPGSDCLGRQDRRNNHRNHKNRTHFVAVGSRHFSYGIISMLDF